MSRAALSHWTDRGRSVESPPVVCCAEPERSVPLREAKNTARTPPASLTGQPVQPAPGREHHGDTLILQNAEIDRLELPRIQDDDELEALKASHALLSIRASESLRFDPRLDPSRRFCRPWTRDFTEDLGQAFYHRFHQQIQVNSAVRTVKVQKKLRRHNRNAAPSDGDTASSHLAGVTVDLQRRGMSKEQIRWMEHYLFYMKALGLVEPEEERHQWVFHIMVSGKYADWRMTQDLVPMEPPDAPLTAVSLSE